jgi:hypothetical protein
MSTEKITEKDDDEIVAVETPPEQDDDERLSGSAEGEGEGEDSPEGGSSEVRAARREERRRARERRRKGKEMTLAELDVLRRRNEELERRLQSLEGRTAQQDLRAVDERLSTAQLRAQHAERVLAEAVQAGDGTRTAQALRARDEALHEARELSAVKTRFQQADAPPERVDPRLKTHAQEWMEDNPWYDPDAKDEDSAIVNTIDNRLAAEGWDPTTAEYWDELQRRVEKRLPSRTGAPQKPGPATRRGPPIGGGREHASLSTKREVYVSPEAKQAMVEAGVWDDKEKRKRVLQRMADAERNATR